MNNFSKLGLSDRLVSVLDQLGFDQPTPVQSEAIPLILSKNPTDFIGLAQTGTGKTAAFGLPLVDIIDSGNRGIQALVLAPTRELGQQTANQLESFVAGSDIKVGVVYGGASIEAQIKMLRRSVHILVATPGRLIDLTNRRALKLDQVTHVVLDEADEMLNMGFQEDIDEILSHTPDERVTWLFSATMPGEIRKIVGKYMNSPVEVAVNTDQKSNKDIAHKYVITKTANKLAAIRRFMDIQPDMRGIMFCRTKRETQEIADQLGDMGYGVEALHGDLSQSQRTAVMQRFKARSMQLLIATDVAARGIDVSELTHVLHHTLPDQLESYTHRSGRTGRAGRKGISLAFINPREGKKITLLENKIKVQFEKLDVPSAEELKTSRINNWAHLIVNTKVDDQASDLLQEVGEQFAHLSKEDILKRLITTQLDHLMIQSGEASDLNETHGGAPGDRDQSQFNKYFINVGSIDGVTKSDLLHFLSDMTNIKRKFFGDITLKKNCAYFDVDASRDKQLAEKFFGVEIEGREIKVNLESSGKSAKPHFGTPKKKFKKQSTGRVKATSRKKEKVRTKRKRR